MIDSLFALWRGRIRGRPWSSSWDLPRWQAHRGYHLEGCPENTLESLIEAASRGARMCEFDVRATRDGVPVLFHDRDLFRMTGRNGRLDEITFRELRGFHPVTTLEEVLGSEKVPAYLNVEIKSEEIWNDPLERRVAETIRRAGAEDRVLFSSFNPFSLWKLSHLLPATPRALLVAADLPRRALREMALAPLLELHGLHLEDVLLTDPRTVADWREKNLKVAVWTVNRQEDIRRFWRWGIDSVITDLIPGN